MPTSTSRRTASPSLTKASATRRGLALEALGVGGADGERARRLVEPAQPVVEHVLAAHRDGERVGALGPLGRETDFDHLHVSPCEYCSAIAGSGLRCNRLGRRVGVGS